MQVATMDQPAPVLQHEDSSKAERKQRGAWYTPIELADPLVHWVCSAVPTDSSPLRVIDPACGDGRLLTAIRDALPGRDVRLFGCDIDASAVAQARAHGISAIHGDALGRDWAGARFDIVVGNPPFLSQMAASTTRGGASSFGGGPYADAAVEFMALAGRLARTEGGVIGLVLPQSILGARDAEPVRCQLDAIARRTWSWWSPNQQHFEAAVNVCMLGWQTPATKNSVGRAWTTVVTDRLGIPHIDLGELATVATLGDRCEFNANFRDEYYALVPAVSDEATGPPLVTSGLIDPGECLWGTRPVRFAKRRFDQPRVDIGKLTGRFPAWARRKLVPKVLIANQTRIIEAVCDEDGAWLPGVPVTTATPLEPSTDTLWATAAVLTSPVASALAWHQSAGTGLSTSAVRVGPRQLAQIPVPRGDLATAIRALQAGDVAECGRAVTIAFGLRDADRLVSWWVEHLPGR